MTTLQLLAASGGVLVLALYIAVICFATGCEGDCGQGRRPCNCKRGSDA